MVSKAMGTHKIVQQVNVGGEKRAETEDGVLGYRDTLEFRGQAEEKQADSLSRGVRKGTRTGTRRMQCC